MRTLSSAMLALTLFAHAAAAGPAPHPLTSHARPPRPGVVLVAMQPGHTLEAGADGSVRARDAALAATLQRFALANPARLSRGVPRTPRPEFYVLRSDAADFDPYAAAAALRALPGVVAAAPDLRMSLHLVPNDPYLSDQWYLGTSVAAMRVRQAWDITTGSPGVAIGILDTGVDVGHEDFAGKLWQNPGEIPGNSIDDDLNGYVDDVNGWDFGNDDPDPSPNPVFDLSTGIDVGWHGTYVAGLAAAASNNGIGIAGVAWGCRVMALKVADSAGDMPLSAVTAAILYAIDNGAGVLNMSLGSPEPDAEGFFQPLMALAFDGNVVTVSSAGNDGTDERNFPAACDSVLSVGATNSSNNRASFSNWGEWVDIAAPGEQIWSSIARNYEYDEFSQIFFEVLWYWDTINPYMYGDGTSASSPLVAGAAALVRSRFPSLTAAQVAKQLVLAGDARAYDNPIGPRMNIERALQAPLEAAPAALPAALAFAPPSPNPAAGRVRFAFTLPAAAHARLEVVDAQGRLVDVVTDRDYGAGSQSAAWDGRDGDGRPVAAGLYFAVLRMGSARAIRRLAVVR
jgi:subtilisin family serine protease